MSTRVRTAAMRCLSMLLMRPVCRRSDARVEIEGGDFNGLPPALPSGPKSFWEGRVLELDPNAALLPSGRALTPVALAAGQPNAWRRRSDMLVANGCGASPL
jgi:hypothetical protein